MPGAASTGAGAVEVAAAGSGVLRGAVDAVSGADEGVTPRLLSMGLPGVPEDRRPTELSPGLALAR